MRIIVSRCLSKVKHFSGQFYKLLFSLWQVGPIKMSAQLTFAPCNALSVTVTSRYKCYRDVTPV